MQLLDIYSGASLTSQNAQYFPIQVWEKINCAKEKIGELSSKWTWSDTPLHLAGIGTPKTIIAHLAAKGTFVPYVTEGSIRKNVSNQDMAELQAALSDSVKLFDEEQQLVLEFAGQVVINGFDQSLLKEVEDNSTNVVWGFKKSMGQETNHECAANC